MILGIPVLVWLGFAFSCIAWLGSLVFGINMTVGFLGIFAVFWVVMYSSEYKLPFKNALPISILLLTGHIVLLLLRVVFRFVTASI